MLLKTAKAVVCVTVLAALLSLAKSSCLADSCCSCILTLARCRAAQQLRVAIHAVVALHDTSHGALEVVLNTNIIIIIVVFRSESRHLETEIMTYDLI